MFGNKKYDVNMPNITIETSIEASVSEVWAAVKDIEQHVRWMDDAVAIHFVSSKRSGVGTIFDCETRIGLLKLTDRMEITEWDEERTIGVSHEGLVSGSGKFTLSAINDRQTRFTWDESLNFPFWMGGPFRNFFGAKILERVWIQNLKHLKKLVEEDLSKG